MSDIFRDVVDKFRSGGSLKAPSAPPMKLNIRMKLIFILLFLEVALAWVFWPGFSFRSFMMGFMSSAVLFVLLFWVLPSSE